ncbi:MarR family winged helix-turn-helix transcriptional regulator [Xanthomonas theicola]|uniref:MarR family transcriptional regulator n=2 Tax=Xanthomonas theicola TaxID=56464 RepID=A0A2S6ZMD6_9XANT|nr:MarR family transcriptional regulator [Xanthomonas theicola]PPT93339.1 MarR family transcriptional regulator [Xanthomonas theicola]QNH27073.1 MarR family transcriptional regulator [Xanthomonas theicola]
MTTASSPPGPPSFGLLLRQVRDGLMRCLDRSMAELELDLCFGHYLGMKALAHMSPCTANELAQAIDQNPSAVTRLLDKFQDLGWVRREAHAQDRRALQIVLTDEGRALWQQLKQRGDEAIASALRDLSAAEREHLTSLLTRVRDSLNSP